MKKILVSLAVVASAIAAVAEMPMPLAPLAPVVATNATLQTSVTSEVVTAYFDGIYLDIGGTAAGTCTVVVATAASNARGPAKTLLTVSALAADGFYQVRNQSAGTTGAAISGVYDKFPLMSESLVVSAYNANVTGVTVRAYITLSKDSP